MKPKKYKIKSEIKISKTLIFLDIDNTLIDRSQKSNDPKLPSKIKILSKKGFLFGLNSNRSLEDVLPIYQYFHLNGPMILENGVYFIQDKKRIYLIPNPIRIRPAFTESLINKFVSDNKISALVKVTDSVASLRSKRTSQTPLLILANKYRKYTGSIHLMRYGKRDTKLADKLARFLRKEFKNKKLALTVERSIASGNVIFYPKNADKGKALRAIRKYYPSHKVYMVGDDAGDLKTLKQADAFMAVGNAQTQVKRLANYVAEKTYTKGVSEILDFIALES